MVNGHGPTTLIGIRHAEYSGVNPTATTCGTARAEEFTTTGWQRVGGPNDPFGPASLRAEAAPTQQAASA
jgi:hypothetical protein